MRTLTAFVDPDRASEKIEDQVEAMIGTHSVEGDESVFALQLQKISSQPRRRLTTKNQKSDTNLADKLSEMMKTQGSFKADQELNALQSNLNLSNLLPNTPQYEAEGDKSSL